MYITLSGTSSVGKSTIFSAIKEKGLVKLKFLPEVAQKLFDEGKVNKVGSLCTFKDQLVIFEEHHKQLLSSSNFFSDRSVLDAFVYATQNYIDGAYSYYEYKQCESLFLDCIKHYDKIIFIPLTTQPLVVTENRDVDLEFRIIINDLFLQIIKLYNLQSKVCIVDTSQGLGKQIVEVTDTCLLYV